MSVIYRRPRGDVNDPPPDRVLPSFGFLTSHPAFVYFDTSSEEAGRKASLVEMTDAFKRRWEKEKNSTSNLIVFS